MKTIEKLAKIKQAKDLISDVYIDDLDVQLEVEGKILLLRLILKINTIIEYFEEIK